jgi:hypothetical protein
MKWNKDDENEKKLNWNVGEKKYAIYCARKIIIAENKNKNL